MSLIDKRLPLWGQNTKTRSILTFETSSDIPKFSLVMLDASDASCSTVKEFDGVDQTKVIGRCLCPKDTKQGKAVEVVIFESFGGGGSETLTSLSVASNILSYTDEIGNVTNIDLSLYLDDSNLARIQSGFLDSISGIATFTRDDSTTFTLDFSSLNDSSAIIAAISAHEVSADPHPQYQTAVESQAQVDTHANLTNNPHQVTKNQVGLGNVDNTSDIDKPVSTAQAAADTTVQNFSTDRANHTGTQLSSTISNFATTVLSTLLAGFTVGANAAITAGDTVLGALGKIQGQINEIFFQLTKRVIWSDVPINLYVAPDIGSSQPGDFIGPNGIFEALEEANKYRMLNQDHLITIYLRDGEYAMTRTIEANHPQGAKHLRLRALTPYGSAASQTAYAAMTGVEANDIAALDASYSVTLSYTTNIAAFFIDRNTGFESILYIYIKKTGTKDNQGIYTLNGGYSNISGCAISGFRYPIYCVNNGVSNNSNTFIVHNERGYIASSSATVTVSVSANYHIKQGYNTIGYFFSAVSSQFTVSVSEINGKLDVEGQLGSAQTAQVTQNSTASFLNVVFKARSYGVYIVNACYASISNCTVLGNTSYAVYSDRTSTITLTNLTVDPAASNNTIKTVRTYRNSITNETGTHVNGVLFSPAVGDVSGANLGSYTI